MIGKCFRYNDYVLMVTDCAVDPDPTSNFPTWNGIVVLEKGSEVLSCRFTCAYTRIFRFKAWSMSVYYEEIPREKFLEAYQGAIEDQISLLEGAR